MDEKTLGSMAEPTQKTPSEKAPIQPAAASTERADSEQRQAYGTAKTENLRDSGLWRTLLPAVVILSCGALLVIPLIILIPLLYNSIQAFNTHRIEGQLIWLWVTMIVIEVGLFILIARGIMRIFLTQAGNYQHSR
ncbi:hypothetical protein KDA_34340 [Dictyobacter alpinus]|uniref:Uncharacterized protein n=1 Tax=Dictyobacter alpinus TaxID=2014873 RepID=A0A402B9F3_9CHLR|nr:hypothetical protein [Dictyobacter alpinus]GCE27950.1 hypothetical protein KDA_34340 [Dictyobacter alpinus]